MTTKTIAELRTALGRLASRQLNYSDDSHALLDKLADAVDELAALRTRLQVLTAERDQWKQAAELARAGDEMKALHGLDMQRKAVEAEREACAKACEANANRFKVDGMDADLHHAHMADARDIRARGKL